MSVQPMRGSDIARAKGEDPTPYLIYERLSEIDPDAELAAAGMELAGQIAFNVYLWGLLVIVAGIVLTVLA